jgi:hypothetical protein
VGFRRTQVLGNYWPEFKNPPTDRFIADHQSALSQKILDIPIAQREPEVEPDSMSDDVRWKSMAGVGDGVRGGAIVGHGAAAFCGCVAE